MRGRHLLTKLGANAVPAVGWFADDWSPGTTLLLYWLETLTGTVLLAGRIMLHRRVSLSKGHWDYEAPLSRTAIGAAVRHSSSRSSYPRWSSVSRTASSSP